MCAEDQSALGGAIRFKSFSKRVKITPTHTFTQKRKMNALDLSRKSNSPESQQQLLASCLQLLAANQNKRKIESEEPECKKSKTESSVSPLDLSFKSAEIEEMSNTSDSGNHSDGQGKSRIFDSKSRLNEP